MTILRPIKLPTGCQYTQKIDIPCRNTLRQARFMIPMAISLGFGVLFATLITLVLVPCFYLAFEDLRFRNAGKLSPAGYIETADHRSSEEV